MPNPRQTEASPIRFPAAKVGLFLLLLSMTMLFLSFSIGYVFTRNQNGADGVHLPPIFIINSFILIASSWAIVQANKSYREDSTKDYQKYLSITMALTLVFMLMQIIGWVYFKEVLIGENIGNGSNYLYAISGLHFAHILGGLPFLAIFLYNAYTKMKEPITVLIYFSDPDKKMRLELLTIYWHFLDGLWIFLVLFFLLNMAL